MPDKAKELDDAAAKLYGYDNVEKLKNNSVQGSKGKNGGARPGAGRKKGGENQATKEKREALKQFKERVEKNVDRIFNSQFDLAIGEKYLYVTTTYGEGSKQRRETTIVTDPETIKRFIDEEDDMNTDTEYYYMTTKPANNMALDSLLNRAFGKPQEHVDHTTDGERLQAGQFVGYVIPGITNGSNDKSKTKD